MRIIYDSCSFRLRSVPPPFTYPTLHLCEVLYGLRHFTTTGYFGVCYDCIVKSCGCPGTWRNMLPCVLHLQTRSRSFPSSRGDDIMNSTTYAFPANYRLEEQRVAFREMFSPSRKCDIGSTPTACLLATRPDDSMASARSCYSRHAAVFAFCSLPSTGFSSPFVTYLRII